MKFKTIINRLRKGENNIMQERHLNEMFKNTNIGITGLFDAKSFSEKIKHQTTNIPDESRTPYEYEVVEMVNWIKLYKQQNPKASRRQMRNDIKKHFHITTVPNVR